MGIFHGSLLNQENLNDHYYSNVTSDTESTLLIIYTMLVFVFGAVGNLLVIVGSLKYKSTKFDRVTIIFVRHLAISDAIAMIVYVLPTVMVHIAKGWKFGETFCYLLGIVNILPGFLHATFIMFISLHRLIRCYRKLSFTMDKYLTANVASIASGVVYCVALTVPFYYYFTRVVVQFHLSNCVAEQDDTVVPLKAVLKWIHLAEYFVIVASVLAIAGIACYMGQGAWRNHRRILSTTFAVVAIYLVSWTPLLYSWVWVADPAQSTLLAIPDTTYKIVIYFFMLSLVANPVIYTCINRHFKNFLESEIRSSLGSISTVLFAHRGSTSGKLKISEKKEDSDHSISNASVHASEEDQEEDKGQPRNVTRVSRVSKFQLTPLPPRRPSASEDLQCCK